MQTRIRSAAMRALASAAFPRSTQGVAAGYGTMFAKKRTPEPALVHDASEIARRA